MKSEPKIARGMFDVMYVHKHLREAEVVIILASDYDALRLAVVNLREAAVALRARQVPRGECDCSTGPVNHAPWCSSTLGAA